MQIDAGAPRRPWRGRAWRQLAWQIAVVAAVAALVAWLGHNTAQNMRQRGIQSGFDFLAGPAGFARALADRIVFMEEGRIVEQNTPREFFDHPRSERCHDFLSKVLGH